MATFFSKSIKDAAAEVAANVNGKVEDLDFSELEESKASWKDKMPKMPKMPKFGIFNKAAADVDTVETRINWVITTLLIAAAAVAAYMSYEIFVAKPWWQFW